MIRLTEQEYNDYCSNYCGVCLKCKNVQDCVEPDAENYTCDECGEKEVYGIEQLLIMDEVEFVDK